MAHLLQDCAAAIECLGFEEHATGCHRRKQVKLHIDQLPRLDSPCQRFLGARCESSGRRWRLERGTGGESDLKCEGEDSNTEAAIGDGTRSNPVVHAIAVQPR